MANTNANAVDSPFISSSVWLPQDDVQRMIRITELFNQTIDGLSYREIGIYETTEIVTGQQWNVPASTNQDKRIPFRKVFTTTIVGSGTRTLAHGITNIINCTRIFGTAVNSTTAPTTFIPLPQSAPDDVNIVVNQTNILITAATGTYNNYTATVVIEYFRQ